MTVLDRFLKYVTFDTQSNEETGTTPSTPGQRVFAEALVKELEAIGMEEISLDENSYVILCRLIRTRKSRLSVLSLIWIRVRICRVRMFNLVS